MKFNTVKTCLRLAFVKFNSRETPKFKYSDKYCNTFINLYSVPKKSECLSDNTIPTK